MQRVPTITSSAYDYGWHSETAKNVIRQFSIPPNTQRIARGGGHYRLQKIDNHYQRPESSHQVADEIRPGLAILAGNSKFVPMIETSLIGVVHVNR